VAAILALAVRALAATWRVRRLDAHLLDGSLARGPVVLALLHGDLLVLAALHRGRGIVPLTSLSADGELLDRVLGRLGYTTVRGSSRRGAVRAGLAAMRALGSGSPAVAVDGPRGPLGTVHRGVLALAATSARPLVFALVTASPALRLRSWDRFRIPLPFARVQIAYGLEDGVMAGRDAERRAAEALGARMRALAGIPEPATGLRPDPHPDGRGA